jgi:hypothetical protein
MATPSLAATLVDWQGEGRDVRKHTMFAPVSDASGDGDDRSRYDIPHSTAKCEGCATTDISSTIHGDGDSEINGGTTR